MGRNYKAHFARKKRERKQQKGKEEAAAAPVRTERPEAYEEIIKENEKFIRYYKHMNICPESEWDSFIETLKSDLPTTFRISGCQNKIEANKILNIVENQFVKNFFNEETAEEFERPFPLPWYPNKLAWQMNATRKQIRRSESLYKLHNFLIAETESGSISRQEAVSMIPPLALDVKPHHKVLDTCAAPGSKTAQIIEALHADSDGSIPSGFVIANDVNNSRCYMLVHQAKRLNTPCFIVTNQDSTCLPKLKTVDGKALKFDRILCDVPCTGDGTLRKNPDLWKRWHFANGLNLHGVQYRVVKRGVELLEVGGRLVYSTCSLNPVENEAVLHRLLKDSEGALELVDISHHVPGLKYVPGINYWEVADKDCNEFYRSFDDVPEQYRTLIRPQMFPPAAEDADKFGLNRCLRVLPHHQNTGGFFVAALTKKRLLPWERKTEEKSDVQNAENGNDGEASECSEPQAKKKKVNFRFQGYNEDPFVFFAESEPIWKQIKEFYDVDDTFDPTLLLTRSIKGKKKNLYFCSDAVKQFVQANESNVKLINTGIKVFARCDHRDMKCAFRMVNEGLDSINHMIGKNRRIEVTKDDMVTLLSCTDTKHPTEHEKLSERAREQMGGIVSGSCILVFNGDDGLNLNVVGWKGAKSLRAYLDLHDSVHLLRLLDADVSKFEKNKFSKTNEEKESKDDE